jgi:hypothetical protein
MATTSLPPSRVVVVENIHAGPRRHRPYALLRRGKSPYARVGSVDAYGSWRACAKIPWMLIIRREQIRIFQDVEFERLVESCDRTGPGNIGRTSSRNGGGSDRAKCSRRIAGCIPPWIRDGEPGAPLCERDGRHGTGLGLRGAPCRSSQACWKTRACIRRADSIRWLHTPTTT